MNNPNELLKKMGEIIEQNNTRIGGGDDATWGEVPTNEKLRALMLYLEKIKEHFDVHDSGHLLNIAYLQTLKDFGATSLTPKNAQRDAALDMFVWFRDQLECMIAYPPEEYDRAMQNIISLA